MAADKKSDKKNEKEEGTEADANAAAEAKRKKKKLFMMIGLGVLLIAISIGSTVLVLKLLSPKKDAGESASESSEESAEVKDTAPTAPAIYFALKPNFTVNYDVNGRQRFLQTELTLMYRDEAVQKVLELHMPTIRNGLVMLLSSQTFDELQTTEGKEKLRAAALKTIQDLIAKEREAAAHDAKKDKDEDSKDKKDKKKNAKPEPTIEQVLFTQFVMQ